MADTLFGPAEPVASPTKLRTPPPEWLVRKLIALGVQEETARGYENRQAHAVLKRMEAAPKPAQPEPEPAPRSPAKRGGATVMERRQAVADLERDLAGGLDDALHHGVPMCLYVLTYDEIRLVAKGLIQIIRKTLPEDWK